jgi:hypothetical protein
MNELPTTLAALGVSLPMIGVCISFVFREELHALWKGSRAKWVNNTYEGSYHWKKSHDTGQGEYVRVMFEKSRGKGAGCHFEYINSGRKACLPWGVYNSYEFQDLPKAEEDACRKAWEANQQISDARKRVTVEELWIKSPR